jgi:hypothetical protein
MLRETNEKVKEENNVSNEKLKDVTKNTNIAISYHHKRNRRN